MHLLIRTLLIKEIQTILFVLGLSVSCIGELILIVNVLQIWQMVHQTQSVFGFDFIVSVLSLCIGNMMMLFANRAQTYS